MMIKMGEMMKKKEDPRVIRTRNLLMTALTDLIQECRYEEISVSLIVRNAGVNRSTFYLHFLDKEDIIEKLESHILTELKTALYYPNYHYSKALRAFKKDGTPIKSVIALFQHINKYKQLYKYLLRINTFHAKFIETIKNEVLKFHSKQWEAIYMASGITGVITRWVENEHGESVENMGLLLTNVILFPLGAFNEDI